MWTPHNFNWCYIRMLQVLQTKNHHKASTNTKYKQTHVKTRIQKKCKHSYRLPLQYLFLDAQLPSRQINLICLGVCVNYTKYKGLNQKKTVIFFLGSILCKPINIVSHCVAWFWWCFACVCGGWSSSIYEPNLLHIFVGSCSPTLLGSLKNPWELFRSMETSTRVKTAIDKVLMMSSFYVITKFSWPCWLNHSSHATIGKTIKNATEDKIICSTLSLSPTPDSFPFLWWCDDLGAFNSEAIPSILKKRRGICPIDLNVRKGTYLILSFEKQGSINNVSECPI